ncbi:riboflavin synthase subunit alpha [Novosphingobium marinum]|uniref:Riboflavin synthase n=1 Tax=Novosphingobium marinum TaxID=1514948 RepID=A0A7Y9XYI1_9SPHN|nr:riboflavin synthase [Novosphingobium marinum]NYH96902.1 riboflavin synthase [Novosphingobium marinum]GGC42521.1 riboflavin synthase subunit alpha [Novosphingobium marinum]
MFTGIVSAVGTIEEIRQSGDLRIVVSCPYDPADIDIGASIACSGVCLTVVERGGSQGDAWFAVDASSETVSRTAKGRWQQGGRLNLERALRLGEELGGHIVTGHVDGVGSVAAIEPVGDSRKMTFAAPAALAPYIAPKGSITIDGVSLTVNEVEDQDDGSCRFSVNVIPHTSAVTTLGTLETGVDVNLEIDVLARYLQRIQSLRS